MPAGRARPRPPARKVPGRSARAGQLKEYRAKRHFDKTPEPAGKRAARSAQPQFTIQKHDATRLHYDLRLEVNGVLKSWAIPKGPSLDPRDRRLAVQTEDHPLEYLTFEGVIPEGEYGAGAMIVWDTGTYRNLKEDRQGRPVPMTEAIEGGSARIWLDGKELKGGFALVRSGSRGGRAGKDQWFLIKLKDEHAAPAAGLLDKRPESATSGKTIGDLGGSGRTTRQTARKIAQKRTGKSSAGRDRLRASSASDRGHDRKPTWIAPMLATLVDKPITGGQPGELVYEHKYDGFRALAFRDGATVRLLSRNGKSLADRFPEIADALREQPLDDFIVDGEVVALRNGRPSFSALQTRLKATTLAAAQRGGVKLRFYVFDMLYAAGYDMRHLPLLQRKEVLARALQFRKARVGPGSLLHFSKHETRGDGAKLLEKACREGWEGLIAKRAADPYTSGRSRSWLKLKCSLRQEFVIGGYTDPQGSRPALGALLVGYYERGKLLFAGKVGTGYTDKMLRELLAMLEALERKTSPFAPDAELPGGRTGRGIHFVQPRLVCEVGFSEWTHDHHIRHPRFQGLRLDKKPALVRREKPVTI